MGGNQLKGTIFDIRRFSTHDGDGIRTTIFLKGCPLSCVWCHNPEGIRTKVRPIYFRNKCIHCQICQSKSKNSGIRITEKGLVIDVRKEEDWDEIIESCPSGALVWDSFVMTVEEIINTVMKDLPFYKYGGGVTLSGGEPLVQGEFVLEVVKELKRKGIHTAIETALHVPSAVVRSVMPYLDLIYADLKLFDEEEHICFIGKTSEQIKENIRLLLESDRKQDVIVRTPLIPGITAGHENIADISSYISGLFPEVRYELLNYNPLAESKYQLIDKSYYFEKNPRKFTKAEMLDFAQTARKNGVKNIILES